MSRQNNQFDSYIHRVHKRWIFWRLLERMGLSIAVGCAIALILGLILMSRGESALPLVSICITIGFVLGALAGWMNRPSMLDTAGEVDRQFGLADLLATALLIRQSKTFVADSQDQPWSATVLAIADARCTELAGQSLLLRRYGPRAWGGIGLASATVLTLGFLSSNPMLTRAGNRSAETNNPTLVAISPTQNQSTSAGRSPQIPLDNQPESLDATRIDSGRDSALKNNPTDSSSDSQHDSNAAGDRAGAGAAQTAEAIHHQTLSTGQSGGNDSQTDGHLAAGGGSPAISSKQNSRDANSSGEATNHMDAHHAGDWSADRASESPDSIDQKIKSNSIPDAYRDLVRDYFDRD